LSRGRRVDDFPGLWYTIGAKAKKEVGNMAVETQSKSIKNGRREYLVAFGPSRLGKALRTLARLGFTREIRCYPERRVLLLEEEVEALREQGIQAEEALLLE